MTTPGEVTTMPDAGPPARAPTPDPDLLEYVVVSVPSVADLAPVVDAVAELVEVGHVRLVDAVALLRPDREAAVVAIDPRDDLALAPLGTTLADDGVRLTPHVVDLAAATLAPGAVMLLLLVEDRWAALLAAAASAAGGRLTAGERIGRDRVLGQMDPAAAPGNGARPDLLARGPLTASSAVGSAPAFDSAAQVRELAQLLERGLLTLDQYEAQRRRVLDG
jgi:hypothetical protein